MGFYIFYSRDFLQKNFQQRVCSKTLLSIDLVVNADSQTCGQSYKAIHNRNLRLQSCTDQKIAHITDSRVIIYARKMFIRMTTDQSMFILPPFTFLSPANDNTKCDYFSSSYEFLYGRSMSIKKNCTSLVINLIQALPLLVQ